MKTRHLLIPLALGVGLTLTLLWTTNSSNAKPSLARAADRTVCTEGPPTCGYSSIQAAVDAANDGDVVKVAAGTYTSASTRAGTTQMVYLTKTIAIHGGYTTTNGFADPPDPRVNPTMLDAQRQGRVLYIVGSISPTIEGLRITGGDATGAGGHWTNNAGGGICIVTATATISNNHVFDNRADYGGGVLLRNSPALLNGNTIISNATAHIGGGLYLWASDATLEGNTIVSNTAGTSGGGMHLWASDARLEGNIVVGNTAHGELSASSGGGGVYLEDGSDAVLVNNAVVGNQVFNQGSGLYIKGSSVHLLHNTVARNDVAGAIGGRGSGIYVRQGLAPCNVVLTNTILSHHGTGVHAEAGTTVALNGVLWYDNTMANTDGNGAISVTDAITGDPAFAPDGYHIGVRSAALDQGVDAGVLTDIDGNPRGQCPDDCPDLGADEALFVYLPLVMRNP